MMPALKRTDAFEHSAKKTLKPYPLSRKAIDVAIEDICKNPNVGDVYPGFSPAMRKIRFPLKEYKIGKSGGMRLIFTVTPKFLVPILLYFKGQFSHEHDVQETLKVQMKTIIHEIREQEKST
ncbi:MAG: hypothetical protein R3Y11_08165 [Pseudomonadota bacterium]